MQATLWLLEALKTTKKDTEDRVLVWDRWFGEGSEPRAILLERGRVFVGEVDEEVGKEAKTNVMAAADKLGMVHTQNVEIDEVLAVSCNLSREDCILLASSLQNAPNLTTLDLENNQIEDDGCSTLATQLQTIPHLSFLNLARNKIGPIGCSRLADHLHKTTSLTSLDLGRNNIGTDGCSELSRCLRHTSALTSLNLSSNRIGDEGCRALSENLGSIRILSSLNLAANQITLDGCASLAAHLKDIPLLSVLTLRENNIGHAGCSILAEHLQNAPSLTWLDLTSCKVGHEGCKSLSACLEHLPNLVSLKLKKNQIGDIGCRHLSEHLLHASKLNYLSLAVNGIRPDGYFSISTHLNCLTALTSLNLASNHIDDDRCKSLFENFRHLPNLSSLNLKSNTISKIGCEHLCRHLHFIPQLNVLNLASNNLGCKGCETLVNHLYTIPRLTSLDLSRNNIGSISCSSLSDNLQRITSLTYLNLASNNIGPSGSSSLARNHPSLARLTWLHLGDNNIGEDGCSSIVELAQKLPRLESLYLAGNDISSVTCCTKISSYLESATPFLTTLHLQNCKIVPETWQSIASAVASNPTSQLQDITGFDPSGISFPPRAAWPDNSFQSLVRAIQSYRKDAELLSTAAVFLVGDSTHGKTTLADALDPDSPPRAPRGTEADSTNRTIGLELRLWRLPSVPPLFSSADLQPTYKGPRRRTRQTSPSYWGPPDACATIFDLAGQEVYGAGHALFRCPEALFLLVVSLDPTKPWLPAVRRWCGSIVDRNPSACVAVVCTSPDKVEGGDWQTASLKVVEKVNEGLRRKCTIREHPRVVAAVVVDARSEENGGGFGAWLDKDQRSGKWECNPHGFGDKGLSSVLDQLGAVAVRRHVLRNPKVSQSLSDAARKDSFLRDAVEQEHFRIVPASVNTMARWLRTNKFVEDERARRPLPMSEFARVLHQVGGKKVDESEALTCALLLASMGLALTVDENKGAASAKVLLDVRLMARAVSCVVQHVVEGSDRVCCLLTEHEAVCKAAGIVSRGHAWAVDMSDDLDRKRVVEVLRLSSRGFLSWSELESSWREQCCVGEEVAVLLRQSLVDAHFLAALDDDCVFIPSAMAPCVAVRTAELMEKLVKFHPVEDGALQRMGEDDFQDLEYDPMDVGRPAPRTNLAGPAIVGPEVARFGRRIQFKRFPTGFVCRCLASIAGNPVFEDAKIVDLQSWGLRLVLDGRGGDVIRETVDFVAHDRPYDPYIDITSAVELRSELVRSLPPAAMDQPLETRLLIHALQPSREWEHSPEATRPWALVTQVLARVDSVLSETPGAHPSVYGLLLSSDGTIKPGDGKHRPLPQQMSELLPQKSSQWVQWKNDGSTQAVLASSSDSLEHRASIRRDALSTISNSPVFPQSICQFLPDELAIDWDGSERERRPSPSSSPSLPPPIHRLDSGDMTLSLSRSRIESEDDIDLPHLSPISEMVVDEAWLVEIGGWEGRWVAQVVGASREEAVEFKDCLYKATSIPDFERMDVMEIPEHWLRDGGRGPVWAIVRHLGDAVCLEAWLEDKERTLSERRMVLENLRSQAQILKASGFRVKEEPSCVVMRKSFPVWGVMLLDSGDEYRFEGIEAKILGTDFEVEKRKEKRFVPRIFEAVLVVKEEKLGKGTNGTVVQVHREGSDAMFAAKVYNVESQKDAGEKEYEQLCGLFQTIAAHELFAEPLGLHASLEKWIGLDQFFGKVDIPSLSPALILRLYNGSLDSSLQKWATDSEPPPTLFSRIKYWKQCVEAVHEMHKRRLMHCDLKPANFFVDGDRIRLGDMGSSRSFPRRNLTADKVISTEAYQAPEETLAPSYGDRYDVFSLGLIGYELISLRTPWYTGWSRQETRLVGDQERPWYGGDEHSKFDGESDDERLVLPLKRDESVEDAVIHSERGEDGEQIRASLCRLIDRCCQCDPTKRPTAEEVLNRLLTIIANLEEDLLEKDEKEPE